MEEKGKEKKENRWEFRELRTNEEEKPSNLEMSQIRTFSQESWWQYVTNEPFLNTKALWCHGGEAPLTSIVLYQTAKNPCWEFWCRYSFPNRLAQLLSFLFSFLHHHHDYVSLRKILRQERRSAEKSIFLAILERIPNLRCTLKPVCSFFRNLCIWSSVHFKCR